jgi:hypothetical protein
MPPSLHPPCHSFPCAIEMASLPEMIIDDARRRQHGRCALCGVELEGTSWIGHHVNGNADDPRLENCALLCGGTCHYFAHAGDWEHGVLLIWNQFPYWYG